MKLMPKYKSWSNANITADDQRCASAELPLIPARVGPVVRNAKNPAAELVPRVNRCDRIRAGGHVVARDGIDAFFGFEPCRIDAELLRKTVIDADERWVGDRDRRLASVKSLGQLRVAVVELR